MRHGLLRAKRVRWIFCVDEGTHLDWPRCRLPLAVFRRFTVKGQLITRGKSFAILECTFFGPSPRSRLGTRRSIMWLRLSTASAYTTVRASHSSLPLQGEDDLEKSHVTVGGVDQGLSRLLSVPR